LSKRLNILQAWEDQLETTVKKLDGYNNDLSDAQVTLTWKDMDNIQDFPFVVLASGDAQYYPLTQTEYTSGNSRQGPDGWTVAAYCYQSSSDDINNEGLLTQAMEKLAEDVVKATLSDVTLGLSYVHHIYLRAVLSYLDDSRPVGVMQLVFEIKYDFDKSAP
jgi:hypothetical protein